MEILSELGLLDAFLARAHNRIDRATIRWFGRLLTVGDLSHLPVAAPFIAMMPQWDFLDFLNEQAERLSGFVLRREAEVTGFVGAAGRVAGVRLADGSELAARLVIAADGRRSVARASLPLRDLGSPIDVLWFRVPRDPASEPGLRAVIEPGRVLVFIDRLDYWQCAMVVAKGAAADLQARGIEPLRAEVEKAAPELGSLAEVLPNWDVVKLLSVGLDRLDQWSRPGLLAIGDAAHTMSPIGGIGINLAIQDAVATANVLAAALAAGRDVDALLGRVQARRMVPTRIIQGAQRLAQNNLLSRLIDPASKARDVPLVLKLLDRFPLLRRIPGRAIGLGFRREHVRSPTAVHNADS
jgi:2-polyprenyl-6-methoxyphenol hydroxylase-like FAD-dependent oxidoreductase